MSTASPVASVRRCRERTPPTFPPTPAASPFLPPPPPACCCRVERRASWAPRKTASAAFAPATVHTFEQPRSTRALTFHRVRAHARATLARRSGVRSAPRPRGSLAPLGGPHQRCPALGSPSRAGGSSHLAHSPHGSPAAPPAPSPRPRFRASSATGGAAPGPPPLAAVGARGEHCAAIAGHSHGHPRERPRFATRSPREPVRSPAPVLAGRCQEHRANLLGVLPPFLLAAVRERPAMIVGRPRGAVQKLRC